MIRLASGVAPGNRLIVLGMAPESQGIETMRPPVKGKGVAPGPWGSRTPKEEEMEENV